MKAGFHHLIEITDKIWVGNGSDERQALSYVRSGIIDRVLIVAQDMDPSYGWRHGAEYMHVGLVDGPGNLLATYHAAVLALVSLVYAGKVLVCCHNGGRSLAVVIMYQYLMGEGPSWIEYIDRWEREHGASLSIHAAHREAFFLMDWGMLSRVLTKEVTD